MFHKKMVNDLFANINNSNQQQFSERPQENLSRSSASNCKTYKKSSKSKRSSHTKSYYNADLTDPPSESSAKKGIDFGGQSKTPSKSAPPTKVKSASWKRSEKSIVPFNALTNKKHKTLRQKSPNWLIFSNSKTKKADSNQLVKGGESASACRPGTLYSDVLFGAGSTKVVKIKNCITPRFCNNPSSKVSQKKLTNALFKCNGNQQNETSDESEIEGNKNLFPALQETKNKFASSIQKNANDNLEKISGFQDNISNSKFLNTSSTTSPTKETYEEADVVILSDLKELSLVENDLSYGNYLEQNFQPVNGNLENEAESSAKNNKFLISSISNIPKWNFMSVETGPSDAFPKFLCQFDDENYLKAEKMALLGLKLAIGNYSPQNK